LLLAVGFILGYFFSPSKDKWASPLVNRDTVVRIIPGDTIYLKAKGKIEYRTVSGLSPDTTVRNDTVKNLPSQVQLGKELAFTASLDTIIKRDTVFVSYMFPENLFELYIKQHPDSVMTFTNTITKNIEIKEVWYVKPAYISGSIVLGYILRSILK
jgi:hypothetical protein